jgi:hypothetical protein
MSFENIEEFFRNIRDRSITVCENCPETKITSHQCISDLGYCFYRPEETFYAAETGILKLSWGAYSIDQMDMLIISNAIMDEAVACKLNASWSGSINDRIILKNLDKHYFITKMK